MRRRAGGLPMRGADFPRSLWLLAVACFVLFTGRGMAIPFMVIFFGQVVGLGEGLAGAGLAVQSIVGVVLALLAAGSIDRVGARTVLILAIFGIALTTSLYPVATSALPFFSIMVVQGMAVQLYWPSSDSLATSLIPISRAGEMFALIRVANSLGMGAGGLIAGLLVAGGGIEQYRVLFLVSGVCVTVAGLMVLTLVPAGARPSATANVSAEAGDWHDVLADRRFIFSQGVMFLLLAGFTQLQISVPPFLRAEAGISEAWIGLLFTINTVIVVVAQLWVARTIAAWRRGLTLALAALFWSVAYLLIAGSLWLSLLPFAGIAIFTVGQMLFLPTAGVVVVEQAPERLRGRYLSFGSAIWGSAHGSAAWGAGLVLASDRPVLVFPGLIALLTLGALGGLIFDRMRPQAVTGSAQTAPSGSD